MAKTLQFKRYSTSQLGSIAGAQGELIVDTNQYTISVHDGITQGGNTYLATQSQLNANTTFLQNEISSNTLYFNAVNNYQNTLIRSAVSNTGPQLISGNLYISNTTASTSNTTGALVVSGGIGVGGNVFIGGSLSVAGNTVIENTYINNVFMNTTDTLVISNTTPSISTGTGALQILGGAGIAGNINIGGANSSFAGNVSVTGTIYQNGITIPTLTTILTYSLAF